MPIDLTAAVYTSSAIVTVNPLNLNGVKINGLMEHQFILRKVLISLSQEMALLLQPKSHKAKQSSIGFIPVMALKEH